MYYGKEDISKRLVLSLTPSSTDSGQHRFNHDGCPAGEDTKRRLYIKIPHERPWERIAYCHNCGGTAFVKLRSDNWLGRYQNETFTVGTSLDWSGPATSSDVTTNNFDEWPNVATTYVHRYITDAEATKHHIEYDIEKNRLVYPSFYADGSLATVQYRAVYRGDSPKYLTKKGSQAHACDPLIHDGNGTLVLTEDLISAIVLNRFHCTLPCFGTHVSAEHLHQLSKQWDNIVVWFDNDNPTVINHAQKIADTLCLLGAANVFVVKELVDPKIYSVIGASGTDVMLGGIVGSPYYMSTNQHGVLASTYLTRVEG